MLCNAPFMSAKIKNDKICVCCNSDYKHNDGNFLKKNYMRDLILTGKLSNTLCQHCSLKNLYNDLDDDEKKIIYNNIKKHAFGKEIDIFMIDITLGRKCNNKCIICRKILNKIEDVISEENYDVINKNLNNITRVIFMGGETMLYIDDILEYINKFKKLKKIYFVTNGSIFNEELFNKLYEKKIKTNITISIDGYKELTEYLRFGSSCDKIFDNIKKFEKYSNVNISFNITISIFNCLEIYETLNFLSSQLSGNKKYHINLAKLIYPYYFNIENIYDDNLTNKINKIINDIDKYNFKNLIIENDLKMLTENKQYKTDEIIKNIKEELSFFDKYTQNNHKKILNKEILEYIWR